MRENKRIFDFQPAGVCLIVIKTIKFNNGVVELIRITSNAREANEFCRKSKENKNCTGSHVTRYVKNE